jgi:hypothetical protein
MPITYETVTLEQATRAIGIYNRGEYRGVRSVHLDERAAALFAGGLSSTLPGILGQITFVGRDYGGVAGFPAALELAPAIANDILAVRDSYAAAAATAPDVMSESTPHSTLTALYSPFVRPFHGKRRWHVWATKFWHFLNPLAFPMEDSRVDKFYRLFNKSHSVDKYEDLLRLHREFTSERAEWVPRLRKAERRIMSCDSKLWDKVYYGVYELTDAE